jgi:hypothetical protein
MISGGLTGMPITLLPLRLIYPKGYLGDGIRRLGCSLTLGFGTWGFDIR